MSRLEVVRAGAGSGKTTDLCATVVEAVANGVDPARILATTFTRKAAAELKGRIQAKLIEEGDGKPYGHQHADRLELAAIGTVHSVAHQLLTRYAVEMGLSPRLEVLEEGASIRALRDLLGAVSLQEWEPLAECAHRLGVDDLNQRILGLLAAKRGNRISEEDFECQMATSAERVCELLLDGGIMSAETPLEELHKLMREALQAIDSLNDQTGRTQDALQKLRRIQSTQFPVWAAYVEATKVAAGKRSGADNHLNDLRLHASQVRNHPRLHADIREFAALLARETAWLDRHYQTYKAERGLVDFTDLEILFLDLLENEALVARLTEDFDLVLVDEFQDTNPLQLAIFQRLRELSARSRWVGDSNQAIYGFRDADPRLVSNIWETAADANRIKLPFNYRSQRGLVQFVGRLFSPMLGEDAIQEPKREAVERGIERWSFFTNKKRANQQEDALALACGIARLRSEEIPWGDIAVLERANVGLARVASACDELEIPYLLQSPGLLATREGAMVLAGLRLVADRNDSLAAATILHLLGDPQQQTPDWIIERLEALRTTGEADADDSENTDGEATYHTPWGGDARFAPLERMNESLLSPLFVMQHVIEALELPQLVRKWGDAGRRCSHLDSLLRHAREHEELALKSGRAATLGGLILYLEDLAGNGQDFRYPPQGHDAVTLVTYHSAKGLEWPVVILSGLDSERDPDMWSPVVTGAGGSEGDPLAGRTLRSWIWPFGMTDGRPRKQRKGSALEDDALASAEGEERTAQEQEENLRLLYVGCTRAKRKLVFAHREGKYGWLSYLPDVDSLLDPNLDEGEYLLEEIDTTFVLRRLSAEMADGCQIAKPGEERWIKLPAIAERPEAVSRFQSPSEAAPGVETTAFDLQHLPGPPHFPQGAGEDQYAAIGQAVHSYLAALPSIRSLDGHEKKLVVERCLAAYSVTGSFDAQALVSAGDRFCEWVERTYPGATWHTEVAASGPRSEGGQWNGTIDLLLQLPDGKLVLIDHKSAPIRRDHCETKAGEFSGQLDAYREVLRAAGETVESAWIHFPLAGVLAQYGA
ncbi:MAG: UvrD-helicase domain-containing protein [Planctomycetota bacterium]